MWRSPICNLIFLAIIWNRRQQHQHVPPSYWNYAITNKASGAIPTQAATMSKILIVELESCGIDASVSRHRSTMKKRTTTRSRQTWPSSTSQTL
jgi:hypothetical protein